MYAGDAHARVQPYVWRKKRAIKPGEIRRKEEKAEGRKAERNGERERERNQGGTTRAEAEMKKKATRRDGEEVTGGCGGRNVAAALFEVYSAELRAPG